jgi:hypothetical protein
MMNKTSHFQQTSNIETSQTSTLKTSMASKPLVFKTLNAEEDFLDLYPDCIVNIVSCTGIKRNSTNHRLAKAFPQYTNEYKRLCLRNHFKASEPYLHDLGTLLGTRYIVSLPIKTHWKENLQPELIKKSIENLVKLVVQLDIESLAFPLFQGPPVDWIEKRMSDELSKESSDRLTTLYFFKEE